MKFPHILTALWAEPWLIRPETHRQLCHIVAEHTTGAAHAEGGILDQFEMRMRQRAGVPGLVGPCPEPELELFERRLNAAVIALDGVIGKRVSAIEQSSGMCDVDQIGAALAAAVADDSIEGVILSIDSPGGTLAGVPELANQIILAREAKPIIAFGDKQICSAAYWIAAACDEIIINTSTEAGSIGVYMAWLDMSRRYENEGIKRELITTGAFKGMGIDGLSITPAQRELLEARVADTFDRFAGFIRENRPEVDSDLFQGQVLVGENAAAAGLVDSADPIDGLESSIEELQALIDMKKGQTNEE